jgi:hypothetical protein
MHFKPVFILVLLLFIFTENVFGQTSFQWARSEQPKGLETEKVLESQLPFVRARIEGRGDVWVGQAVTLNVEMIVPTWFTGAPKFTDLEVPNAVTLSPEAAVNFVVQSAGKIFSAQGRRYLIFPQVKGKYTVPSAKVEVAYALPDGTSSPPATLASTPIQFEARLPPGAEGAKYYLTTSNFRISQSLDRKVDSLKVGDAIIRTISMTAEDTVGMTLPHLTFDAPDGIRLYPGVPRISEKAERGKIEATRVETATYVLGKEGGYKLREIAILWWSPQTQKMNKAVLPSIEFKVEENPGSKTEVFASSEETEKKPSDEPRGPLLDRIRPLLSWVPAVLGIIVFLIATRQILSLKGISIRPWLTERRKRRADAEITYFKRFRKACLSNDARGALRELMFWLDYRNARSAAPTLEQFERESGMTELLKEEEALNGILFARPAKAEPLDLQTKWSGRPFYRVVAQARSAQIDKAKKPKSSGEQLPSLNPRGAKGE